MAQSDRLKFNIEISNDNSLEKKLFFNATLYQKVTFLLSYFQVSIFIVQHVTKTRSFNHKILVARYKLVVSVPRHKMFQLELGIQTYNWGKVKYKSNNLGLSLVKLG